MTPRCSMCRRPGHFRVAEMRGFRRDQPARYCRECLKIVEESKETYHEGLAEPPHNHTTLSVVCVVGGSIRRGFA